ncbi:glycosyltransferase [Nocardioides campestrisoli]|uniref:glycosyltransferase n=1 Tax=Nocardioides campestrisoli TaxID=2736757 RepID=UPI0015E65781
MTHGIAGPSTVTVGIPFANEPPSIIEASVRSVFAQTSTQWRLMLVGDNPRQDTVELLTAITDPRVELVVDQRRLGLASRLNQLARMCDTPLLARMDADDVMHPDRLATQVRYFSDDELDVTGSRAIAVDESMQILGRLREPPLPDSPAGYLASHAFTHPTVMGRTQWFRKNPYDESLRRGEDKELWLRTNGTSRFLKTPEDTLFYRVAKPRVAKHRQDAHHDRAVIRRHARALVGIGGERKLLIRSMAKEVVFSCTVPLGAADQILRRKVDALDEVSRAKAQADMTVALGATVPGWPS